jgi:serine/threonine protein kinase
VDKVAGFERTGSEKMLMTQPAQSAASGEMPRSLFGYEVLDFIGEGAGSLIYVVVHPESRQLYAMKHVRRRHEKDERFFEQLRNEFEVSRKFSHPALRRSVDMRDNRTMLRKPSEAGLVMELFDGTPLEARRPESPLDSVDCFIQVAQGLLALHNLGFIHCDLKPNNILLNADGVAKLIDFGQACPTGAIKERIQGTPDFISPEQVRCMAVSPRTDVFNFGATLYWALSGKTIPTLFTIKRSDNSFLMDDRILSPREINPAVPENLSSLVMECVRTNPAKRPPDMHELTRRLEIIRHVMARRTTAGAA